ncbi:MULTISPECIES: hypothetical protein [unclassified Bradyrhizobium]|uniref:hypothetical protein n=1 Tax=unclassified Bradyrhizobium TaxID=2631580 RepID=UPI001CD3E11F|nr:MULTISPECIES: hypothetical protein [unclassified Bradyrhizobium]MCA1495218.1 hypothetical protein [Bradyrhizobium sp. NBAIM14]MCA1531026.1 hypothetical protein [Bradyrhizobium sp. NBAIM03]
MVHELTHKDFPFGKAKRMTLQRCGYRRHQLSMLMTFVILLAIGSTGRSVAEERADVGGKASTQFTTASAFQRAGYPVFDSQSFWYQPIPRNAPLHQKSAEYAQEFARQVKTYYGHIGINFSGYSSPVYTVKADVPNVTVKLVDCWHSGYYDKKLANDFAAVPIPNYAEAADGTDSEMSIYQPDTDLLWELWQARKVGGQWQACWGGRMPNTSRNPGIWERPYGAAATGLPFAPGQILADELRAGEIDHVIGIALVAAEAKVYSWPANRSDGKGSPGVPNAIPEGIRFRLDPALDIEKLNLHPIARTIARAAQKYGFVVWDLGGSVALRAENPKRYTLVGLPSPYPQLFGNTPAYAIMNRFPWDKMQFLPADYGKPK